jgi:minor extracellular serine protease Vpr
LKSRNLRKLFSSLLVLLLVFTMVRPMYGTVEAESDALGKGQLSFKTLHQMKAMIAQQKALSQNGPTLHSSLKNLSGEEEVSVIVQFSEPPVALVEGIQTVAGKPFTATMEKSTKQKVATQQLNFEKHLATKGVKAKLGFKYNYTFNGMALKVKASEVDNLLNIEGVTLVEPDIEVRALGEASKDGTITPAMNTSLPNLDVPAVWAKGFEGQNVKVAVLDTGIDYHHPEFEGVYRGGYNFINQTTAEGYSRTRAANDPYETSPLDRLNSQPEFDDIGNSFYTSHGTHVAGTIAAQGNNPHGIKGLAPKIELYAYRVLGAYGNGTISSVIAGIDKAAADNMDIMNLSLSGSSNSQTAADAIAINNATLSGTLAVVATGNAGPERGTIGDPSTAAFALSVGNATNPSDRYTSSVNVHVEGSEPATHQMNLMAWKFGESPETALTGEFDLVAVPNIGAVEDYAGLEVNGKVVLVSRGTIPFIDKIAAAKANGAAGIIIHNNTGETPSNISLGDSFSYIPTYDMNTTDGNILRVLLQDNPGKVTFSNFTKSTVAGDDINSSSSRGPSYPVFDIKPDVSAPGTNIMSTIPAYKKDNPEADYSESFDRFTGTSMATPHVAGIAALLKSMHPEWTPFDLKVAITNTAKQLDVTKYDVFTQGSGLVQPLKAVTAEALAYSLDTTTYGSQSYDNVKGTITFGNVATNATAVSMVTKDVLVKNLTGNPSDYNVSVQVTKAPTGDLAGANVTVDQSSFTLTDEQPLKVNLQVPAGVGAVGDELLGYVKITNGTTNLLLPFAANFAPLTGLKDFTVDSLHISPNGDGKFDHTTVRYEFHNEQHRTYLELWDAENQAGGYYEDGYVGYLANSSNTSTGPKTVEFNGSYTSWDPAVTEEPLAPDGVYSLDLTTLNATDTAVEVAEWIGPVYIKTTEPTIVANDATVEGTTYAYSGSVSDAYVDWKNLVEEVFGESYDVNDNLHGTYELLNPAGVLVDSQPITLEADGTFNLNLAGLLEGANTLKVSFDDEAGNHAEKEVTITSSTTVDPDPDVQHGQGLLLKGTEPMENITFSVHTTGENPVWYDFVTDEQGAFTYQLPDGDYMAVGVWESPTWYPLNKVFTIQNGLVNGTEPFVIDALDYQLPSADQWNIKGSLTNGANTLANLPFSVHTVDGSNWYDTRTDSKGNFVLQLPDNDYQLDGIWVGAIGKWYELNQLFTVKNGSLDGSAELTIDVKAAAANQNVKGTLTKGTQALSNVTFSFHTASGETWYDVQTDENGQFGIKLPDGSYTIDGVWNGAEGRWYVLNQTFTVAGTLQMDIDVTSGPGEELPNVAGVLTKGQIAVAHTVFSIEDQTGNWFDTVTDANGNFDFTLKDGTYTLHGIWVDSESKWYELNTVFTVKDGQLEDMTQLLVDLP